MALCCSQSVGMFVTMCRVLLKKAWTWRGKTYPRGTVFELTSREVGARKPGGWYNFSVPNVCRGFVYFPDSVFKQLTADEKITRAARERARDEHLIASTRDRRLVL